MSADRLSFLPSLPWPSLSTRLLAKLRFAKQRNAKWSARRYALAYEGYGTVVYYANAEFDARANARASTQAGPTIQSALLLLHGMHHSASAQELAPLFDAFRAQRPVYAPDLPGFGASDRDDRACFPELYIGVIKQLIELCACDTLAPVDVVAVGLTSEYAARAVAALPDMVRTFTMIDPTGFASAGEERLIERIARGESSLPLSALARLGLQRLWSTGFASLLSGSALPRENPQAVYTRVHCPALVLHTRKHRERYGALARFVRWRDHYLEQEVDSTSLADQTAVAAIETQLSRLFASASVEDAPAKLEQFAG